MRGHSKELIQEPKEYSCQQTVYIQSGNWLRRKQGVKQYKMLNLQQKTCCEEEATITISFDEDDGNSNGSGGGTFKV